MSITASDIATAYNLPNDRQDGIGLENACLELIKTSENREDISYIVKFLEDLDNINRKDGCATDLVGSAIKILKERISLKEKQNLKGEANVPTTDD